VNRCISCVKSVVTITNHNVFSINRPAATVADPEDPEATPFVADAIIANPPVIGHIHVAEALAVPCHIMFPQPWYYGTKDFPHPMAGLEYVQGRTRNLQSYSGFEALMWTTFQHEINKWRFRTLHLPHIYAYANSINLVKAARLPFAAMWSPSFVPRPDDWPEQCDVVGSFVTDQKKDFDVTPFAKLHAWLDKGEPPIFIGFGSMVIKDPKKLETIIKEAAHAKNLRVVVQSSWTKLDVEDGTDLCRNVGPCPHDWLLPLCCAVVHHGGAGTTAAGLRFGLPTLICPFFGDQFMWGFFVEMAGVGPKASPVTKLTAEILAEKLEALAGPDLRLKALELGEAMSLEDGIDGGLEHFMEHLPRDNMLCDISLMLGENRLARYELIGTGLWYNGIKVSTEVAALLESESGINWHSLWKWCPTWSKLNERYWYTAGMRRHPVTVYNVSGHINAVHHGCFAGFWALIVGGLSAIMELFYTSDRFARSAGAFGCIFGLVVAVFFMCLGAIKAVIAFFDRIALGISNGLFGTDYDYILDPSWKARVHVTPVIEAEKDTFIKEGIPKARKKVLTKALELVVAAREVFEYAQPTYPMKHRHFVVVSLPDLISKLMTNSLAAKLMLTEMEVLTVIDRLESHAKVAPPPKRRSTKFRVLKQLKQTISIKTSSISETEQRSSSLKIVNDATPSIAKKEDELEEEEEPETLLQKAANSLAAPAKHVGKLIWHKKPEETEISFTMFLQALHAICSSKCLYNARRSSTILSARASTSDNKIESLSLDTPEEFSEYLT